MSAGIRQVVYDAYVILLGIGSAVLMFVRYGCFCTA
jgi:hypothetical protein